MNKTLRSILLSATLLFLGAIPAIAQPSPGGSLGTALNTNGNLAFLHVDSIGRVLLAGSGPGLGTIIPGGQTGVALDPNNNFAFLHVDANGGLIVSGSVAPFWSGLTPNGLLQATNSTTVGSTLTPSGLTSLGVNGLLSAALSPLTLGTGTFGTSVTFASATGVPTFATGAVFNGALSGITTSTFTPASGGTATTTPGIIESNTTVSTAGATVQYSPSLQLIGHAWNTTPTAADNYVQARQELRPVSGTAPTSTLAWSFSTSATSTPSYADALTLSSAQVLTFGGGSSLKDVSGAGTWTTTGAMNLTSGGVITLSNTTNINGGLTGTTITSNSSGFSSVLPSGVTTSAVSFTNPPETYTVTGTNTATNFQANYLGIPTFTNASIGTITNAATLYIAGAPVAAGSQVITNAYSLYVAGPSIFTAPIQYGGLVRTTAGFTATSNTVLANITALTVTVAAGKTYMFRVWAPTTATTAGGVQFAIAGTATATYITYEGNLEGGGLFTQTRAAALATAVCSSATATTSTANITGSITVNAGGTLTVQFAQATSNAAASTVLQGSYFEVWQTSN